jgi:hypothetical protein
VLRQSRLRFEQAKSQTFFQPLAVKRLSPIAFSGTFSRKQRRFKKTLSLLELRTPYTNCKQTSEISGMTPKNCTIADWRVSDKIGDFLKGYSYEKEVPKARTDSQVATPCRSPAGRNSRSTPSRLSRLRSKPSDDLRGVTQTNGMQTRLEASKRPMCASLSDWRGTFQRHTKGELRSSTRQRGPLK